MPRRTAKQDHPAQTGVPEFDDLWDLERAQVDRWNAAAFVDRCRARMYTAGACVIVGTGLALWTAVGVLVWNVIR